MKAMIKCVKQTFTIVVLFGLLNFSSCKKIEQEVQKVSSLTLVHAVVNAGILKTNFKGREPIRYATARGINFGVWNTDFYQYTINTRNKELGLFHMPDTLIDSEPLFLIPLDATKAPIQTIFLTGTLERPVYQLVEEHLPRLSPVDSLVGVRFVHLAPGQQQISVFERTGNRFQEGLNYLDVTQSDFHMISARKGAGPYVFEFKDTVTGQLLADFNFDPANESLNSAIYRNRCISIVLVGGSYNAVSTPLSTFLVHHF